MRRIVVSEFVSLDGVFESPFHWAFDFRGDDGMAWKFEEIKQHDALLLGRTTYDEFAASWPQSSNDDPFTARYNSMPKYVVTRSTEPLEWQNSTALSGDLATEIAALKAQPGHDLLIHGSGTLVDGLKALDLIDEYRTMIFPVVGSGRKLFAGGTAKQKLKLVETIPFASGPVVLVHHPLRD